MFETKYAPDPDVRKYILKMHETEKHFQYIYFSPLCFSNDEISSQFALSVMCVIKLCVLGLQNHLDTSFQKRGSPLPWLAAKDMHVFKA